MTMKKMNLRLNKSFFVKISVCMYLFFIFVGCDFMDKNHDDEYLKEGFTLDEIKIENAEVDSVTADFVKKMLAHDNFNKVLIMEILAFPFPSSNSNTSDKKHQVWSYSNDTLYFSYSWHEKEFVSYIFRGYTKRIIGYAVYEGKDVILLSNITDEYMFKAFFKSMFRNTKKSKYFSYIKYPDYPPNVVVAIYDPLFLCYKMVDFHFVDSLLTKNVRMSYYP